MSSSTTYLLPSEKIGTYFKSKRYSLKKHKDLTHQLHNNSKRSQNQGSNFIIIKISRNSMKIYLKRNAKFNNIKKTGRIMKDKCKDF